KVSSNFWEPPRHQGAKDWDSKPICHPKTLGAFFLASSCLGGSKQKCASALAVVVLVVFARGEVVEARVSRVPANLHLAGGAVALLGDDDLGNALLVAFLGVVVLVAIDEEDVVGVLLDGARLAKVRKLRPLVLGAARFDRAIELRKRDDRNVEL